MEKYIILIMQFLIFPTITAIITGLTVYYFQNKKNQEKDKLLYKNIIEKKKNKKEIKKEIKNFKKYFNYACKEVIKKYQLEVLYLEKKQVKANNFKNTFFLSILLNYLHMNKILNNSNNSNVTIKLNDKENSNKK